MKKVDPAVIELRAKAVATLVRQIRRTKKFLLVTGGITEECATRLAFEAFDIHLDPGDLIRHKDTVPTQLKRVG